LGLVGCFLLGAVGGAVVMGWLHPIADTSPIDNATRSLLVTAEVERQPVRQVYSLNAQVSSPVVVDVVPSFVSASGSDGNEDGGSVVQRQVVSGHVHQVGDLIGVGDLVAEVSGNPVFAVPSSLPLYRDIVLNSKGSDVAGVQQMLADIGLYSGQVTGEVGPATVKAIASFYKRGGYAAPEQPQYQAMFRLADMVAIPFDGVRVASVAGVGMEVDAEHPLMTVEVSPAVITARVDMVQAGAFPVGGVVGVRIGSATTFDATVTTVSQFRTPEVSQPAGYDITVSIPEGVDVSVAGNDPVVVTEKADVPMGVAVPLTAIRRDTTGGVYVRLAPQVGTEVTPSAMAQVPVTVLSQAAGYAIIEDNPLVPPGARVVVSGD